MMIGDVCCFLT